MKMKQFNYDLYGVLDPRFAQVLVPEKQYRVAVYPQVVIPEDNSFLPEPTSDVTAFLQSYRYDVARMVYDANAGLVQLLEQHGAENIVIPELAPFAIATIKGVQLLDLRWNKEIDFIEQADAHPPTLYDDDQNGLTVATRAVQNDVWWAQNNTGATSTIAIIEAPGIRPDVDYPATPDRWFSDLLSRPNEGGWSTMSSPLAYPTWRVASPNDDLRKTKAGTRHTNGVASVAAGTFYEGSGAKDARLVSGNCSLDPNNLAYYELVDLVVPAEGTLGYLPSTLNHSYGPSVAELVDLPEPYNNAMDFRTRQARTIEVHACGNDGNPLSGNPPRSPGNRPAACNEYNTIKVGGYDDQSTVVWSNDLVWENGSWINPYVQHAPGTMAGPGDRELPELIAPAVNVRQIDADWEQTDPALTWRSTGTSFAAPNVTALATLFLERFPGFATTPEFVRAALLATAVHNEFVPSSGGMPQRWAPPAFTYTTKVGGGYTPDLRAGFGGVSGNALSILLPSPPGSPGQGIWERLVVNESNFAPLSGQTENRKFYQQCVVLGTPCTIENGRLRKIRPVATVLPYERLRMVLAWNSRLDCLQCTPNYIPKNAPMDFDMVLVDGLTNAPLRWNTTTQSWGSGGPVVSLSYDNSYEVIELDPAQTASLPASARAEIRLFGPIPSQFSERLAYVSFGVPAVSDIAPR